MRRPSLLIIVLVAALLAPAGSAVASHRQVTSFEAPRDLLDPAARDHALGDIASFGVHSLRVVLYWRDVAPARKSRVKPAFDPTDPGAYNWSRYDPVLDAAKARGWSVLLTLSGPVPRWATNGARDSLTRPSPTIRTSCARSSRAATSRCRRRSTAACTSQRCAALPTRA